MPPSEKASGKVPSKSVLSVKLSSMYSIEGLAKVNFKLVSWWFRVLSSFYLRADNTSY
jgi:hypothetical protein